jgi:hypothetical protein
MKLRVLGLPVLLLLGCGSSSEPPPKSPKAPVAKTWCSGLPALTTNRRTDLTGKANTFQRVQRIKDRHAKAIVERCPDVTGIGIGKMKGSKLVNDPDVPPERAKRVSDAEKDHLISIFLLSRRHRPERPLFLEGVRLRFEVTGPIRLAPSERSSRRDDLLAGHRPAAGPARAGSR